MKKRPLENIDISVSLKTDKKYVIWVAHCDRYTYLRGGELISETPHDYKIKCDVGPGWFNETLASKYKTVKVTNEEEYLEIMAQNREQVALSAAMLDSIFKRHDDFIDSIIRKK